MAFGKNIKFNSENAQTKHPKVSTENLIFVVRIALQCHSVMSDTPQKSNSSARKRWQPKAGSEARKLGNTEGDWNLANGVHTAREKPQEQKFEASPIINRHNVQS